MAKDSNTAGNTTGFRTGTNSAGRAAVFRTNTPPANSAAYANGQRKELIKQLARKQGKAPHVVAMQVKLLA